MTTSSIFTDTGSGTLAYRVVIDGCPFQPVTKLEMTTAYLNGIPVDSLDIGYRVGGLKMREQRFSERADPVACKLDVGGFEIQLVDVDGNAWSRVFDLEPTATTWITADINASATTIPVLSTATFADSGYIWLDGECIQYGSTDATNFLDCTRGVLSPDATAAQYHYKTDGARLRTPAVTNWPVLWEGRRVVVYRYDDGDLLSGTGTQVYRGVITTAPSFDGKTWRLGVDHMVSVLDQTFGQDLDEALHPRGIHYTTQSPFQLTYIQNTAAGSDYVSGGVSLTGFYETQRAFCDALTTAFTTSFATSGATGTVTAVDEGPGGWHLRYHTDATTAKEMVIRIEAIWIGTGGTAVVGQPLDPPIGATQTPDGSAGAVAPGNYGFPQYPDTTPTGAALGSPLSTDTDYFFYRPMANGQYVDTPLGTVPRGCWSYNDDTDGRTIYLDGGTPLPTATTSILVTGTDAATGNDYTETYHVTSVDAATRSVVLSPIFPSGHRYVSGDSLPEIRLGLALQSGDAFSSVADCLDFVAANSAEYGTLGMMPQLRTEDFDSVAWHEVYDDAPAMNSSRYFVTFSSVSLFDIVREELKAAACFLALDTSGLLVPKRLRLPAASEASAVATVDSSLLLTSKQRAQHEVSGVGQVNEISYKTGFDPATGDFGPTTIKVRDISAFAQSSRSRGMEIGQLSQLIGMVVTESDVLGNVASPIFGALSGAYSIDTLDAAASEGVALGDPIKFDDPYLIEGTGADVTGLPDGELGVVGRVGLVLGKEWDAYSPAIRFTVLNTKQKIAGYAPESFVSSQSNTSGNTWALTLTSADFPSGFDASDFYAAADKVQVVEWNATSATVLTGTVVSVAANVVTVTFTGTWTPGASTWYLSIQSAGAVVSTQLRYCFISDADGVIDNGGANESVTKVFAP